MARIDHELHSDVMHEAGVRNDLLYSMGEILLVIIGILITLQANNWNRERLEQQQVRRYAHASISGLQHDG